MCPDRQVSGAVVRGLVNARIGPFAQGGLDEALSLSVGFGRVGFGADVLEAQCGTGCFEGMGFVAWTIVRCPAVVLRSNAMRGGHHPHDSYPQ